MVVLCDGMVRSGSTWSFNVARSLLRLGGQARVFGLYSEKPTVLRAAVRPRLSHLVIKSHVLSPAAQELCLNDEIRTIYTWRNPYDVVVSCNRMFGQPIEHWIDVLRDALRVWQFHRDTATAHIVCYERLMREPAGEIAGIAAYLGLSIAAEAIAEIAREVSFDQIKRFAQSLNSMRGPQVVRESGRLYHRDTLLHFRHIRNGGTGYGIHSLTDRHRLALETLLQEEGFSFLCVSQDSPLGTGIGDQVCQDMP